MTRADLDAIEARAAAATDGPWAWEATGDKDNTWGVGQVIDDATEQPVRGENPQGENTLVEPVCTGDGNLDDAEFIAHAREDVPALVNEARAGRLLADDARQVRAKVHALLNSGAVNHGRIAQALRGIHADLDIAIAAYTEAVS